MELNRMYKPLVYADDFSVLVEDTNTIKRKTEAMVRLVGRFI
jgi:hypothetical protein